MASAAPTTTAEPLVVLAEPTTMAITVAVDTANYIWRAVEETESPEVAEFALRHMAMIAKQRNAYGLMEGVVRACKRTGIDLLSVLSPVYSGGDSDDTHPLEILQTVSAARGYCQARTFQADGRHAFFNNPAFEHDILSHEACSRAYDRNKEEVLGLYTHPEDIYLVHARIAATWCKAVNNSGQLTPTDGSQKVRVYHRKMCTYVPCSMSAALDPNPVARRVTRCPPPSPAASSPLKRPWHESL